MAKARTLVGLDVHAAKVVAAILDAETGELRFQRLGGESAPVVKLCSSLVRSRRCFIARQSSSDRSPPRSRPHPGRARSADSGACAASTP